MLQANSQNAMLTDPPASIIVMEEWDSDYAGATVPFDEAASTLFSPLTPQGKRFRCPDELLPGETVARGNPVQHRVFPSPAQDSGATDKGCIRLLRRARQNHAAQP